MTARDAGPLQAPVPRAPGRHGRGHRRARTRRSPALRRPWRSPAGSRGYDPRADVALIERAGQVAAEAHATQKRDNGDPYITHPIAVANILADYRLDSATIATAPAARRRPRTPPSA